MPTKLQKQKTLRQHAISELIRLVTASLALVSALAWNQVIQELVGNYIKPFFGKDSGIISLTIYAVIITILAATVTYLMSKLIKD